MTGLVVVLGGTGLLGGAVSRAFLAAGWRVRSVARRDDVAGPGLERVAADVTRPTQLRRAVAGADVVVLALAHRATGDRSWRVEDGAMPRRLYVGVCEHLASWAQGDRRDLTVLHAGSVTQSSLATDYDVLKSEGEAAVLAASGGAVRAVSLRLGTLYGPHPRGEGVGVVSSMVRAALEGRALTVWGGGAMLRDLLAVQDAADAFLLAAEHASALEGRAWLVGSGAPTSVINMARDIASEVSRRTTSDPVPVLRTPPPPWAGPYDLGSVTVDAGPFRERTAWTPRTTWDEGRRQLVEALVERPEKIEKRTR